MREINKFSDVFVYATPIKRVDTFLYMGTVVNYYHFSNNHKKQCR